MSEVSLSPGDALGQHLQIAGLPVGKKVMNLFCKLEDLLCSLIEFFEADSLGRMWAHSGFTGRGAVLIPEGFEMDSEVVLGT